MTPGVAEPWVEKPLRAFVDDAGVQLAIVLHPSGQVVAQHGFNRAVDVMAASSLAAAIHSSGEALAQLAGDTLFDDLYHDGADRRIFLGRCDTRGGRFLLLAIFDEDSSIGLVQLYFEVFRRAIAAAVEMTPPALPAPGEDFDRALAQSLDALFPHSSNLPAGEQPHAAR